MHHEETKDTKERTQRNTVSDNGKNMSTDQRPIVAFDESGNTGSDLLNRDQPVFVLASVHMSDEIAAELIGNNPKELKFSKLKKSSVGRKRILEIFNSPYMTEERIVVSAFHKPFCAVCKIVDILIEPYLRLQGVDLYQRGQNIALANILYLALPMRMGSDGFQQLLTAFVTMIRFPSTNTVDSFYQIVVKAALPIERDYDMGDEDDGDDEEDFEEEDFDDEDYEEGDGAEEIIELLWLLYSTRPIAQNSMGTWDYSTLDPAVAGFMILGSQWTERLQCEFRLVHDNSKPIAKYEEYIKAMMSVDEPSVIVGFDRRRAVFPIRASGVEFRDSSTCHQVQLADIVASAFMHVLKSDFENTTDSFATALRESNMRDLNYNPLCPEAKVSPEELGTVGDNALDPIEYMMGRIDNHFLSSTKRDGKLTKRND